MALVASQVSHPPRTSATPDPRRGAAPRTRRGDDSEPTPDPHRSDATPTPERHVRARGPAERDHRTDTDTSRRGSGASDAGTKPAPPGPGAALDDHVRAGRLPYQDPNGPPAPRLGAEHVNLRRCGRSAGGFRWRPTNSSSTGQDHQLGAQARHEPVVLAGPRTVAQPRNYYGGGDGALVAGARSTTTSHTARAVAVKAAGAHGADCKPVGMLGWRGAHAQMIQVLRDVGNPSPDENGSSPTRSRSWLTVRPAAQAKASPLHILHGLAKTTPTGGASSATREGQQVRRPIPRPSVRRRSGIPLRSILPVASAARARATALNRALLARRCCWSANPMDARPQSAIGRDAGAGSTGK